MQNENSEMETWKKEVFKTEQDFAELLSREGIHKAFLTYADDEAVLMRNDELIKGKKHIDSLYKGQNAKGLSWVPEFVDVAKSGDLAYTYGYYTYRYSDEHGNDKISSGVFHTIWKRQKDGSWKFVWD